MSKAIAAVGALAAGLVVLAGAPAHAQSVPELPADYLGEAGELLPGSVTGSLPGYATGPVGSATHAACNAGSVAGLAGAGVPGMVRHVCMVAPAVGEAIDQFVLGDHQGSVDSIIGGVPYVGSLLRQLVPTESAVEAVEGVATPGSGEGVGRLSAESVSSQLPGS